MAEASGCVGILEPLAPSYGSSLAGTGKPLVVPSMGDAAGDFRPLLCRHPRRNSGALQDRTVLELNSEPREEPVQHARTFLP
jgi:hypothetical protein